MYEIGHYLAENLHPQLHLLRLEEPADIDQELPINLYPHEEHSDLQIKELFLFRGPATRAKKKQPKPFSWQEIGLISRVGIWNFGLVKVYSRRALFPRLIVDSLNQSSLLHLSAL